MVYFDVWGEDRSEAKPVCALQIGFWDQGRADL